MFCAALRTAGLRACSCSCRSSALRSVKSFEGRQLSTSLSLLTLDKDAVKEKHRLMVRVTQEKHMDFEATEEFEDNETASQDVVVEHGHQESNFLIPTEDTLEALYHGIPFRLLPVAHIHASSNNTLVLVTDHTGKKQISKSSCGMEGFKHAKKSSALAAQASGLAAGKRALKQGVTAIRATVKGIGQGRLPAMTGLKMAGLDIVSITERTPIYVNATKPRKQKRK
ncbi:hypothetical protein CAPTEDRAFT_220095 [Capitella teleta]|uniref:Ribosomal protein S11 n=1 Tax=Capitella teleta TaxID=283909 RepID=R7UXX5_CAPTE|nr:hypothetical protein CAPTEDRAFT_220095 [Capitella teleta]|eukprot:ELU08276.1 hypothetical protein CAPTEDRAFT_220095 [Capitella teleta]